MAIHLGNKFRVSVISALCLLALVVTLKNILVVPTPVLTREIVIYILFYSCFGFLCPDKREGAPPSVLDRPLFWGVLIILITFGIIALYAV